MTPRTVATAFRIAAIAEACSWVGLLIGMFVKYVPETSEVGVKVFGPIHGGIFVAYVLITFVAARVLRWSPGTTLLALAASIGREKHPFKRDVRKLKELGLTESLLIGYRISPRGRAVLEGLVATEQQQ